MRNILDDTDEGDYIHLGEKVVKVIVTRQLTDPSYKQTERTKFAVRRTDSDKELPAPRMPLELFLGHEKKEEIRNRLHRAKILK